MSRHSNACHKAFLIPELQTHVSTYLNQADLDSLRQTCRAWYYSWAVTHYQTCTSTEFKLGESKSKMNLDLHGNYIQSLCLENTRSQDTIDLLAHLPNLRALQLVEAALSPESIVHVVSCMPIGLQHLHIQLLDLEKKFPPEFFPSLARLSALCSLEWRAAYTEVHVHDLLYVFKACPGLVVFRPYRLRVSSYDSDTTLAVPGHPFLRPSFAPRPPLFPLKPEDIEGRYVGRRLRTLDFGNVAISDEGLLQLLGIDLMSQEISNLRARRTHALTDLTLKTCYGVTHRSGIRILQECAHLQRLHVLQSGLASMALFHGTDLWPCSPTLQSVELAVYPEDRPPTEPLCHHTAKESAQAFPLADQEQIMDRLQRMTNLRHLVLVGYALDFAAVEDMSFAKLLTDSRVEMMVRVSPALIPGQFKEIEARGVEWCQRQPTGWSCSVNISVVAPHLATYILQFRHVKVARPLCGFFMKVLSKT
ncbi:hypothetical protein BG000_007630 [Podila horticola]|nr:hypothetical protein BG000_007630 [Podila horticola]